MWIWIDLDRHGTMLFSIADGKAGLLVGWKPHLLNEAAISNKQSAKQLIFHSAILASKFLGSGETGSEVVQRRLVRSNIHRDL